MDGKKYGFEYRINNKRYYKNFNTQQERDEYQNKYIKLIQDGIIS